MVYLKLLKIRRMNIKSIVLIILIISSFQSFSQELIAMYKKDAYWGFMNIKGEEIIKPKYTYCRPFYSGMAKVGKIYFINIKGEKLKPKVRISDAYQFSDGLVGVKVGGKWGYMNTTGDLIIAAKYKDIVAFNNGYTLVANKNGTFVIDHQGKETKVITGKGKISKFKKFSEGLAPVVIKDRYGFVNEKGSLIIEPKYLGVGYYCNGLAWARTLKGTIGYINKTGDWVIEPKFLGAGNFDPVSGMARIKDKEGWGYTNMKGEVFSIKNIQVFKHFEDGLCLVRKENIWGYLDSNGKWAIEPTYVASTPFKNGYARARVKGKWGIINKKGEWVLKPIYDNIKPFYKVK